MSMQCFIFLSENFPTQIHQEIFPSQNDFWERLMTFMKKAVKAMSDFLRCKFPRAPVSEPFDNFTPNFPRFLMTFTSKKKWKAEKALQKTILINFCALITWNVHLLLNKAGNFDIRSSKRIQFASEVSLTWNRVSRREYFDIHRISI